MLFLEKKKKRLYCCPIKPVKDNIVFASDL